MRKSQDWQDYRLIDASDGQRLEKWGGITLVRPDPQIIWKNPDPSPLWSKADAVYHRSSSGGGNWEYRKQLPESWNISYKGLTFMVKPTGFKHTGIFPEQAVNWDFSMNAIKNAGRKISVLNLFAYTGAASVACSAAGADVCHVDASKGMVAWAKENALLNGITNIRFIVDDCIKFVEREIRRGRRYDVIIMDPPSYGRGPGGEVWKLEDELYGLLTLCINVLSDDPLFFMLNSYTTGLSAGCMQHMLGCTVGEKFGGKVDADEIGLPVGTTGLNLPCGSTAIWHREEIRK